MSGAVMTRERPIIMTGESVRAILDGRKTQTRRVVKPQPTHRLIEPKVGLTIGMNPADDGGIWYDADGINPGRPVRCPFGGAVNRLWVRETFFDHGNFGIDALDIIETPRDERIEYRAEPWDRMCDGKEAGPWRSPIHMPRWASRLTLEITGVRVDRVQSITEADAQREGLPKLSWDGDARDAFCKAWEALNAARGYSWDSNPYVWCLTFRVVEGVHV